MAGKPIKIVSAGGTAGTFAPEPLALIGTLPTGSVPDATASVKGVVKQSVAQTDSVAATVADLVTDFNALLAKLRTAGLLASS